MPAMGQAAFGLVPQVLVGSASSPAASIGSATQAAWLPRTELADIGVLAGTSRSLAPAWPGSRGAPGASSVVRRGQRVREDRAGRGALSSHGPGGLVEGLERLVPGR